jgi:hypothetical protein
VAELNDFPTPSTHDSIHGDAESVIARESKQVGHGPDATHINKHAH